ncbi:MAG: hypothetical protein RL318_620 [Fibrobacterota bacterium]|jgi:hypothetical protein
MRSTSAIITAVVLGASAVPAFATCADTLFLQSLTRTEKTYRKIGNQIDSSSVVKRIAMDSLAQAAPPTVPAGEKSTDTSRILLSFSPDCGADSISTAQTFRVVDTFSTDLKGNVKRSLAGRVEEMRFKAVTTDNPGVQFANGDVIMFKKSWSLSLPGNTKEATYDVVIIENETAIRSAVAGGIARSYTTQATAGGTSTSMKSGFYGMSGQYPGKGIGAAYATFLNYFNGAFANQVAGSDSIIVRLVSLDAEYDVVHQNYAPNGVTGIVAAPQAAKVGVANLGDGWKVSTSTPAAGFVRSLDGRMVRRFPAGASFVWNGREAAGQKAGRGVYLVGFEGQGASTLVVP